jgi:Tfp pilus assembly ATPase PilU
MLDQFLGNATAVGRDRLVQPGVHKKASEVQVTVGIPPSLRFRRSLRPLSPDDTLRFMRVIAPERGRQEFKDKGSCEFGLPLEDNAHFFVTVFMRDAHGGRRLRRVPKIPRPVDDEDASSKGGADP